MKTLVVKIVAIAVMLTVGIVSASATDFFFDRKWENNLQTSKVKYELNDNGSYIKTKKYDYSYDSIDRITKEEVNIWDESQQSWQPSYQIIYDYNSSYIIEVSRWNKKTNTYDIVQNKMEYLINKDNELIYLSFTNQHGEKIENINKLTNLSVK